MDELEQVAWAKYLDHGFFNTIWPAKAVGYAVFYKLAHLAGGKATSILLIARLQTALLGCATLALIYGCARAIGRDRLRALVIVLVALSFSNVMERIFRTIAEPLALFFAAAALFALLRGRADRRGTVIAAGALSGLSFLATQKALYFDVALGLALFVDAVLARRFKDGVVRGLWLVLGWAIPVVAYCVLFGGADPVPVARNLFFGPIEVATTGADAYGSLRSYVWQTLSRNALLYAFCFAGMLLAVLRIRRLGEKQRIALVFTIVVTALVFAHNQPWPYVFIMALPFMALWSLEPIERLAGNRLYGGLALGLIGLAVAGSFVRNLNYLRIDNHAQMELIGQAESLLGPDDIYFDGVAMIPNRMEPSTLWLDRKYVLKTLEERQESEAYRIFATTPPKLILWTYRMDDIAPVLASLLRDSYVRIAPNIRIAGRRLKRGEPVRFDVPVAGRYALYGASGAPLQATVAVDGRAAGPPLQLKRGPTTVTLLAGPEDAFLLPEGSYAGLIQPGPDNRKLFSGVY